MHHEALVIAAFGGGDGVRGSIACAVLHRVFECRDCQWSRGCSNEQCGSCNGRGEGITWSSGRVRKSNTKFHANAAYLSIRCIPRYLLDFNRSCTFALSSPHCTVPLVATSDQATHNLQFSTYPIPIYHKNYKQNHTPQNNHHPKLQDKTKHPTHPTAA